MAQRNTVEVRITGRNLSGQAFDELRRDMGDAQRQGDRFFSGIGGGLAQFGLAAEGLRTIADGARVAGRALGFDLHTELETTRAQMLAFTKDAGRTDELLRQIREEANRTPFTFKELAAATATLIPISKQANVNLDELRKTAEILAASNPAEGLEGAAFSIREALSGDFVSIVERFNLPRQRLNQLRDEGVPALQAIQIAMREMGIDASLVANLSQTTTGRLSTLSDTIDELRLTLGQATFEEFSNGLVETQERLDANRDSLLAVAQAAGEALGTMTGAGINDSIFLVDRLAESSRGLADVWAQLPESVRGAGEALDRSIFSHVSFEPEFLKAIRGADAFHEALDARLNPAVRDTEVVFDRMMGAMDREAAKFAGVASGARQAGAGVADLGNAAEISADKIQSLRSALGGFDAHIATLVRAEPAFIATSQAVEGLRGRLDAARAAQENHSAAVSAAQDQLRAMQDNVSALSERLSDARQRLSDLASVRLQGMGAFDEREFNLEQRIQRNRLAQLQAEGRPGGERRVEQLRKEGDALQRQLEMLRLQRGLRFDADLRKIRQEAEGVGEELTPQQVIQRIRDAKKEIADLTKQHQQATAAVEAQEKAARALETAGQGFSRVISDIQQQLDLEEKKHRSVEQALTEGFRTREEAQQKLRDLDLEGTAVAEHIDRVTNQMIVDVSELAISKSETASQEIDELLQQYRNALFELGQRADLANAIRNIPRPDTTAADPLRPRQHGGSVTAGGAFLVGEAGPEPFLPGVSGFIMANRALRQAMGSSVNIFGPLVAISGASVRSDVDIERLAQRAAELVEDRLENALFEAQGAGTREPLGLSRMAS